MRIFVSVATLGSIGGTATSIASSADAFSAQRIAEWNMVHSLGPFLCEISGRGRIPRAPRGGVFQAAVVSEAAASALCLLVIATPVAAWRASTEIASRRTAPGLMTCPLLVERLPRRPSWYWSKQSKALFCLLETSMANPKVCIQCHVPMELMRPRHFAIRGEEGSSLSSDQSDPDRTENHMTIRLPTLGRQGRNVSDDSSRMFFGSTGSRASWCQVQICELVRGRPCTS